MKKLIMVILPCIIVLILIWGYIPAARELVDRIGGMASHFRIENLNNSLASDNGTTAKNNNQESKPSVYLPSAIVDNENTQNNKEKEDTDNNKSNIYRIARQYNGKLGIFLPQTPLVPEFIIDVNISSLPPEDKKMFEQGLLINSQTQLTNLIEDYTS